jgi:hypothetical protein
MWSTLQENEIARMLAPLVGAAGGVVAITAAVERFGAPRLKVAAAGAVAAAAAARGAEGIARDALTGVAAAGVCVAAMELFEVVRPRLLYGDKPRPQPAPAPAPAANGITQREFSEALEALRTQLAAQQKERDELHRHQLEEMVKTIHDLKGQLQIAHAEVERLGGNAVPLRRRDSSTGPRRLSVIPPIEDHPFPVAVAPETAPPAEAVRDAPALPAKSAKAPAASPIPPEHIEQMQAVTALLSDEERALLSTLMATMPAEEVEKSRAGLVAVGPKGAVAYLRANVFPKVRRGMA